jgi:hypothetical protein
MNVNLMIEILIITTWPFPKSWSKMAINSLAGARSQSSASSVCKHVGKCVIEISLGNGIFPFFSSININFFIVSVVSLIHFLIASLRWQHFYFFFILSSSSSSTSSSISVKIFFLHCLVPSFDSFQYFSASVYQSRL